MGLNAPTNDLTGNTIATTYDQILFLDHADGIAESTLRQVAAQLSLSALWIAEEKVLIQSDDTDQAELFNVETVGSKSIILSGTAGVVINEDSESALDFRVESDGEDEALLMDASANHLYINKGETAFTTTISNINARGLLVSTSGVVLNPDGHATNDFKVESDGEDEMIFLDSSANTLYINKGESAAVFSVHSTNDVALYVGADGVVLNDDGHATNDFRVESDSQAYMLFVDAGTNKVGIGTATPDTDLHIAKAGQCTLTIEAESGAASQIYFDEAGTVKAKIIFEGANEDLSFWTGNAPAERLTILNSGNVGIGTTAPDSLCHISKTGMTDESSNIFKADGTGNSVKRFADFGVHYNSGATTNAPCAFMRMQVSAGDSYYIWADDAADFLASGTIANIGTTTGTKIGDMSSDERLKDISSSSFPYGLTEINNLIPIKFSMKADTDNKQKLGFGAQTTKPIIPEVVYDTNECIDGYEWELDEDGKETKQVAKSDDEDTKLSMSYQGIIPVLVKAVQELSSKVTALENA